MRQRAPLGVIISISRFSSKTFGLTTRSTFSTNALQILNIPMETCIGHTSSTFRTEFCQKKYLVATKKTSAVLESEKLVGSAPIGHRVDKHYSLIVCNDKISLLVLLPPRVENHIRSHIRNRIEDRVGNRVGNRIRTMLETLSKTASETWSETASGELMGDDRGLGCERG